MYSVKVDTDAAGGAARYELTAFDAPMSYAQVLDSWTESAEFRLFFTEILASSPLSGFRWETPPVTKTSIDRPFEFVLLDASSFATRYTDSHAFSQYFTDADDDAGVVAFANLRGDAHLVVPSPRADVDAYGHLAAFVRSAPTMQIDALWRVVGQTVQERLSDLPLWLSTAGGGVAWLHVRLDSRPKYYGYTAYRSFTD